jgi:hypothetical protein
MHAMASFSNGNNKMMAKMATITDTQLKQVNISTIKPQLWAWHSGIMRWRWLPVVSDLLMFWILIMRHMAGHSSIRI